MYLFDEGKAVPAHGKTGVSSFSPVTISHKGVGCTGVRAFSLAGGGGLTWVYLSWAGVGGGGDTGLLARSRGSTDQGVYLSWGRVGGGGYGPVGSVQRQY